MGSEPTRVRYRFARASRQRKSGSRLPLKAAPPNTDSHIDDSFRNDTSVANPNTPSQQSCPTLDGVALQELDPFDEPAAKTKQPIEAATAEASAATAEIDDVLLVGEEVANSSTVADAPAETASAIERALKALTETSLLAAQQNNDPLLKQIIMSGVEKQTCPEHDRYLIDEKNLVWYTPNDSKPALAVPRSMVPEFLALVHTLHGHAGVGATLAFVRNHFHWPTIARDTRLYVASCGYNR